MVGKKDRKSHSMLRSLTKSCVVVVFVPGSYFSPQNDTSKNISPLHGTKSCFLCTTVAEQPPVNHIVHFPLDFNERIGRKQPLWPRAETKTNARERSSLSKVHSYVTGEEASQSDQPVIAVDI